MLELLCMRDGHPSPTRWCRCPTCREARRGAPKKGPQVVGATGLCALPGFKESLDLLLNTERYALDDVGQMFGVTRERIRQIAVREGVARKLIGDSGKRESAGMMDLRMWDDTLNRFVPVRRKALVEKRKASLRDIKRHVRDGYRAHVDTVLSGLPRHRPLAIREIWEALSGEKRTPNIAWMLVMRAYGQSHRGYSAWKALLAKHNLPMLTVGHSTPEGNARKGAKLGGSWVNEANIERDLAILMFHRAGMPGKQIARWAGLKTSGVYAVVARHKHNGR